MELSVQHTTEDDLSVFGEAMRDRLESWFLEIMPFLFLQTSVLEKSQNDEKQTNRGKWVFLPVVSGFECLLFPTTDALVWKSMHRCLLASTALSSALPILWPEF